MGVDAKIHLNSEFKLGHVVEYLKYTGAESVAVLACDDRFDHFTITFEIFGELRTLFFHNNLGIFGSHLASLGQWGHYEEILKPIVQAFGGIYIPNDCTEENIEVFEDRNAGASAYNDCNALFVHKWALARGLVDDSRAEDIAEAQEQFKKVHGSIK